MMNEITRIVLDRCMKNAREHLEEGNVCPKCASADQTIIEGYEGNSTYAVRIHCNACGHDRTVCLVGPANQRPSR